MVSRVHELVARVIELEAANEMHATAAVDAIPGDEEIANELIGINMQISLLGMRIAKLEEKATDENGSLLEMRVAELEEIAAAENGSERLERRIREMSDAIEAGGAGRERVERWTSEIEELRREVASKKRNTAEPDAASLTRLDWTKALSAYESLGRAMNEIGFVAPENAVAEAQVLQKGAMWLNAIAQALKLHVATNVTKKDFDRTRQVLLDIITRTFTAEDLDSLTHKIIRAVKR